MDFIITTGGAVTAITPQLWSAAFYDNLRAKLPFIESVSRAYEGEIRNLGNTVKIPTMDDGSVAQNLLEGENGEASEFDTSTTDLVINKRTFKDAIVTDQAQLQSVEFMDKLRDNLFNAVRQKMQIDIIDEIAPSTSSPNHDLSYASGTTLAKVDILDAKDALDVANVSEEGRIMIPGASQQNDLLNEATLTSSDFGRSGNENVNGAFDRPILGFTMRSTTAVGNSSFFFHPSFMQMAVQKEMSINVYDLGVGGNRSFRVNVDILWGVKQIDDVRIVKKS